MKKLFIYPVIFFFFICVNYSLAQNEPCPTLTLVAKNFVLEDTLGGDDNMLKWDIYLLHTNPELTGPFYYGSCQYCMTYNPLADDGQSWSLSIIDSHLPLSLQPVNPQANSPTS